MFDWDIGEHPDIRAAFRSGYPSFQREENRDTPEHRAQYIEEHIPELLEWLRLGYPEVLEEFICLSAQACPESYEEWLN